MTMYEIHFLDGDLWKKLKNGITYQFMTEATLATMICPDLKGLICKIVPVDLKSLDNKK